jgi:DNA ligase-1
MFPAKRSGIGLALLVVTTVCFDRLGLGSWIEISSENDVGIPPHLRFVIQKLGERDGKSSVDSLDSIPFYSLCRGLFLPLSSLTPEKPQAVFGVEQPRLNTEAREALVTKFFERPIGLTGIERTACVLGDPFLGRPSTFRQDSLLRLLRMLTLTTRHAQLTRLAQVSDIGILFAESRPIRKSNPPLTAAEVLRALSFLPKEKINEKFRVLKSILARCGKLEAFFLARLLMSRTGLGFEFQRPFLARVLAK